jgi:hypothetical protein
LIQRNSESKPLLREAMAIDEKKLGRENPLAATSVINLARAICRGSGDPGEGERLATRAIRLLAKDSGAQSWQVAQARVTHGICLTRLGRYDDAEREIRGGMQTMERLLGPSHWRVDSARVRMAELERARGQSGAAR